MYLNVGPSTQPRMTQSRRGCQGHFMVIANADSDVELLRFLNPRVSKFALLIVFESPLFCRTPFVRLNVLEETVYAPRRNHPHKHRMSDRLSDLLSCQEHLT
jgi:hypothetical protein